MTIGVVGCIGIFVVGSFIGTLAAMVTFTRIMTSDRCLKNLCKRTLNIMTDDDIISTSLECTKKLVEKQFGEEES